MDFDSSSCETIVKERIDTYLLQLIDKEEELEFLEEIYNFVKYKLIEDYNCKICQGCECIENCTCYDDDSSVNTEDIESE